MPYFATIAIARPKAIRTRQHVAPFAAAAAMSHAGERSLLGAECGHEIRADRVTPLARSGQQAGVTQIGVKQPREPAGQNQSTGI
jgi:hypothetical protein